MARTTRKRLLNEGHPTDPKVLGDLHMLAVAMATLFMAASVAFSWAMGLAPPQAISAIFNTF